MFPDKLHKVAYKYHQSTPSHIAHMAKESNSKKLVLTHISPIFKSQITLMKKSTEEIFGEVIIAEDLRKLEFKSIKYPSPHYN